MSTRIKEGEVIAEEPNEEAHQQESGSGTIYNRLYKHGKSLAKKHQEVAQKAEEDKGKECSFQPNKGRVVRKAWKKNKAE